MQLEQFIATSAADAAQQIRSRLGPEAVVVNVRQLPGRWFRKPRIEVLAHRTPPVQLTDNGPFDPGDQSSANGGGQETCVPSDDAPKVVATSLLEQRYGRAAANPQDQPVRAPGKAEPGACELLESIGLLPLYAQRVAECATVTQPPWLAGELKQVRAALAASWIRCPTTAATGLQIFVGAPGVGKTTALCKWLTAAVLLEARAARVWRLDGETANTAESLSVHGDVLGVPVERSWTGTPICEAIAFVDFPGTEWSDDRAVAALANRLRTFPAVQTHLVLNAAYDSTVLLEQTRAFARLPISDLVVTHLDEEPRWGKLWNVMLGTGLPIRFLSAGQNIPGAFWEASAERVLARLFPVDLDRGKSLAY